MSQSFRPLASLPTVLTVPGLDNSGPDHWQSLWEDLLADCHRVDMGDWSSPRREAWVERLDRRIDAQKGPAVLVAHSLGCLAVAWWAHRRWQVVRRHTILGALLVAPPCTERGAASSRIADFRPTPRTPLPFPSLLVASRNDPCAGFEASSALAEAWGSQLVDAGQAGHINADSGLGVWPEGLSLLEGLMTSVSDARRAVRTRHAAIRDHRSHEQGGQEHRMMPQQAFAC